MNILEVKNVSKRYDKHLALDNVSLEIPKGTIFGLLGPNGAGKTTLIRIINRITAPDEGLVFFEGAPLSVEHVSRIGYLPEERGLYKKMKAGEQALYLAQLKGVPHEEALRRLKFWFSRFQIKDWWNRKVEELSKGMQQKLQFIVTVVHQPDLLILDEPFSGFDPINTDLIKNELLRLKNEGTTIVLSTHDMGSVEELCDSIALVNRAKFVLKGNVQEIREGYSKNLFEVHTRQELSQDLMLALNAKDFEMTEVVKSNGHYVYTFGLLTHQTPNQLLQMLLPQVPILAFREKLPSMHDIFVSAVKMQSSNTSVHE
ncbi:MAG: ABC transporter ATP-binding protein [Bacteroidales bacterium]